MFIVVYVAELIAHDPSITYRGVNVCMRMTINPDIYSAVGNIVAQFCGEGSI